jgi:hypothetical protein
MPRRRHQLIEDLRVDRRAVGDDLHRSHLQRVQGPAEKPAYGVGVAPGRHEHVDDLPVLVDGPVHIPPRR